MVAKTAMIWLILGSILCVWAMASVLGGERQYQSRRRVVSESAVLAPVSDGQTLPEVK